MYRKRLLSILLSLLMFIPVLSLYVSPVFSEQVESRLPAISESSSYVPNTLLVKFYKEPIIFDDYFADLGLQNIETVSKIKQDTYAITFLESNDTITRQFEEKVQTQWGMIDPFLKEQIELLQSDPYVNIVQPEYLYSSDFTPNDPLFSNPWYASVTNLFSAWDIEQGSEGVVIAVIDTGVDYSHPDLASKMLGDCTNGGCPEGTGYDFVNLSFNPGGDQSEDFYDEDNDPMDVQGHGTHVAGIASAETDNGIGIAGTCPNCKIMPIRSGFKNSSGTGSLRSSDIIQGIDYAVSNGADIVNMSFGSGDFDPLTNQSIQLGAQQNVVFVGAAGNSNLNTVHYPSAYDNVISVAAINQSLDKSSFSNYGNWVDVAAPGNNIYSTAPYSVDPSGYRMSSGTSMAAPFVAGVVGLLKSQNQDYNSEQIQTILLQSSILRPSLENITISGGYIDALSAVTFDTVNTIPKFQKDSLDFEQIPAGSNFLDKSILFFSNSFAGNVDFSLNSDQFSIISSTTTTVGELESVKVLVRASSDTEGVFSDTLTATFGGDSVSANVNGTFSTETIIDLNIDEGVLEYNSYEDDGIMEIPVTLSTDITQYSFDGFYYDLTFNKDNLQLIETQAIPTGNAAMRSFFQNKEIIDEDEFGNITIRATTFSYIPGNKIIGSEGNLFSILFKVLKNENIAFKIENFVFYNNSNSTSYSARINDLNEYSSSITVNGEVTDDTFEEISIDNHFKNIDLTDSNGVADFDNDGFDEIYSATNSEVRILENIGGEFVEHTIPVFGIPQSIGLKTGLLKNVDGSSTIVISYIQFVSNSFIVHYVLVDIDSNFQAESISAVNFPYSTTNYSLQEQLLIEDFTNDGNENLGIILRDMSTGQAKLKIDTYKYNNSTNAIELIPSGFATNIVNEDISIGALALGNIDTDPENEIVLNGASNNKFILLNHSFENNTVIFNTELINIPIPNEANTIYTLNYIKLIDFDGDGYKDLFYELDNFNFMSGSQRSDIKVMKSTGTGFVEFSDAIFDLPNEVNVYGVDINNDGSEEIILQAIDEFLIPANPGSGMAPQRYLYNPHYLISFNGTSFEKEIIKARQLNSEVYENVIPMHFDNNAGMDLFMYKINRVITNSSEDSLPMVEASILRNNIIVTPPIALISPENDFTTSTTPEFTWEEIPGAINYRLYLSSNNSSFLIGVSNANCVNSVCKYKAINTEFLGAEESEKIYTWRVEADVNSQTSTSQSRNLKFVKLTGPQIISPTGDVTYPNVAFEWENLEDAEEYSVRLLNEDSNPNLVYEETVDASSCGVTCSISDMNPALSIISRKQDSRYVLQVTARNTATGYGATYEKVFNVNKFRLAMPVLLEPDTIKDSGVWYITNPTISKVDWFKVSNADGYLVTLYEKTFGYRILTQSFYIQQDDCDGLCSAYFTRIRNNGIYDIEITPYSIQNGASANSLINTYTSKYMNDAPFEIIASGQRINPDDVVFRWMHKDGLTKYNIEIVLQPGPANPSGFFINKTLTVNNQNCPVTGEFRTCTQKLNITEMTTGNHKWRIKGIRDLNFSEDYDTGWSQYTNFSYNGNIVLPNRIVLPTVLSQTTERKVEYNKFYNFISRFYRLNFRTR